MQRILDSVEAHWEMLHNSGYMVLVLLAVLVLVVNLNYLEKNRWLAYFIFISLLVIINPIWGMGWRGFPFWGINISYIYSLIPLALVIAMGAVFLVSNLKIKRKKAIAAAVIVLLIISGGARISPKRFFQKAQNEQQVSEFTVLICEAVTKETNTPKIVIPERFAGEIRQYDGNIELLFSVQGIRGWHDPISEEIEYVRNEIDQEYPDMENLTAIISDYNCHYIMIHKNQLAKDSPDRYGFEAETEIGDYFIYKNIQGVK